VYLDHAVGALPYGFLYQVLPLPDIEAAGRDGQGSIQVLLWGGKGLPPMGLRFSVVHGVGPLKERAVKRSCINSIMEEDGLPVRLMLGDYRSLL